MGHTIAVQVAVFVVGMDGSPAVNLTDQPANDYFSGLVALSGRRVEATKMTDGR